MSEFYRPLNVLLTFVMLAFNQTAAASAEVDPIAVETLKKEVSTEGIVKESSAPVIVTSTDEARNLFQRGTSNYSRGRFQEAIDNWQQALYLFDTPTEQALTAGNLALAYFDTGQYIRALDANHLAIALFTELEQIGQSGWARSHLGNIYEVIGDYEKAVIAYEASIRIAHATGQRNLEGVARGNLGYVHFVQGDHAEAFMQYGQSLEIALETNDREGEGHRLLNIGIAHHDVGEDELAQQRYQQSLAIAKEIDHLPLQAKVLLNLGLVRAHGQKYNEALSYFEESLAIAEALKDPNLIAKVLNNLGHTLLSNNQLEAAETQLRQATYRLNALRTELSDHQIVSLFDTQASTYNLLTQVLTAQNKPAAALETSEAGRAQAYAALLQRGTGAHQSYNWLSATQPNETLPISIGDIQKLAQAKDITIVEYTLIPSGDFVHKGKIRGVAAELYIWVVSPSGTLDFRIVDLTEEELDLTATIELSLSAVGNRSRGGLASASDNSENSQDEQLQALYKILIEPIEDLLASLDEQDTVVFVPQGELFSVPFAALRDRQGRYLIENHTILTAPSIQVMQLAQQKRESRSLTAFSELKGEDLLVVGNPDMPKFWDSESEQYRQLSNLSGAQREASEVAALFGGTPLLNSAATERRVRQQISQAAIVHLATHGLLEYGNPIDSGVVAVPGAIALAPDDEYDGLLTSEEISKMNLSANLIVLSACDTGLGQITGDGVVGLARSFMGAGATSVVVSLWSVPDAPTAQLMTEFYRQLKQGKTKAKAMRQAMLKTMELYEEPHDWAAFTIMGDLD